MGNPLWFCGACAWDRSEKLSGSVWIDLGVSEKQADNQNPPITDQVLFINCKVWLVMNLLVMTFNHKYPHSPCSSWEPRGHALTTSCVYAGGDGPATWVPRCSTHIGSSETVV